MASKENKILILENASIQSQKLERKFVWMSRYD
jgi:hypothetical protein